MTVNLTHFWRQRRGFPVRDLFFGGIFTTKTIANIFEQSKISVEGRFWPFIDLAKLVGTCQLCDEDRSLMMADRFQLCADVTESTETWALNDDREWICKGFQKEQKLISLFVDDYQVRTKFVNSNAVIRDIEKDWQRSSLQFLINVSLECNESLRWAFQVSLPVKTQIFDSMTVTENNWLRYLSRASSRSITHVKLPRKTQVWCQLVSRDLLRFPVND